MTASLSLSLQQRHPSSNRAWITTPQFQMLGNSLPLATLCPDQLITGQTLRGSFDRWERERLRGDRLPEKFAAHLRGVGVRRLGRRLHLHGAEHLRRLVVRHGERRRRRSGRRDHHHLFRDCLCFDHQMLCAGAAGALRCGLGAAFSEASGGLHAALCLWRFFRLSPLSQSVSQSVSPPSALGGVYRSTERQADAPPTPPPPPPESARRNGGGGGGGGSEAQFSRNWQGGAAGGAVPILDRHSELGRLHAQVEH